MIYTVVYYHVFCSDGIAAAMAYLHSLSNKYTIKFGGHLLRNKDLSSTPLNATIVCTGSFYYKLFDKDNNYIDTVYFIGKQPKDKLRLDIKNLQYNHGDIDSNNTLFLPINFLHRKVLFLDVVSSQEDIELLLKTVDIYGQVFILDHHKPSYKLCTTLKGIYSNFSCYHSYEYAQGNKLKEKAASEMAWEYFCFNNISPNNNLPWMYRAIADRDLGRFDRVDSGEICASLWYRELFKFDLNKDLYDLWNKYFSSSSITKQEVINEGKLLIKKENDDITSIMNTAVVCNMNLPSGKIYKVYLVECPHSLISKVGQNLSNKGKDFGIAFTVGFRYDLKTNQWWLSTRSVDETLDLNTVVKEFGIENGGHPQAAGLSLEGIETLNKVFTIRNKEEISSLPIV